MKKIVSLLLLLLVIFSISVPAFAATSQPGTSVKLAAPSVDDPNAEQTVWFVRDNNGILEKRLWSLTYRKWLTDWIPCGVAVNP